MNRKSFLARFFTTAGIVATTSMAKESGPKIQDGNSRFRKFDLSKVALFIKDIPEDKSYKISTYLFTGGTSWAMFDNDKIVSKNQRFQLNEGIQAYFTVKGQNQEIAQLLTAENLIKAGIKEI